MELGKLLLSVVKERQKKTLNYFTIASLSTQDASANFNQLPGQRYVKSSIRYTVRSTAPADPSHAHRRPASLALHMIILNSQ